MLGRGDVAAGASVNNAYWTDTPWTSLYAVSNGWRYQPAIFSQLVVTVRDVQWTNGVACVKVTTNNLDAVTITNETYGTTGCGNADTYEATYAMISPPENIFAWWQYRPDVAGCPFIAWPSVNWSALSGCDQTNAVTNAPSFSASLLSHIDIDQRVQYDWHPCSPQPGCGYAGCWTATGTSVGTNQNNTVTVLTNITAAPYVDELCAPIPRVVQFYVRTSDPLTGHTNDDGSSKWWLWYTSPEVGGCIVTAPVFNARSGIASTGATAIGTCCTVPGLTNLWVNAIGGGAGDCRDAGVGDVARPGDCEYLWHGWKFGCWTNDLPQYQHGTIVYNVDQVVFRAKQQGTNVSYRNTVDCRAIVWWTGMKFK